MQDRMRHNGHGHLKARGNCIAFDYVLPAEYLGIPEDVEMVASKSPINCRFVCFFL